MKTKGALGERFHIYNRGVEKRKIFLNKRDYLRFYDSLDLFNNIEPVVNFSFARTQRNNSRSKLVEIEAYCLLPNHFHLVLRQTTENGIGELMKRVSGGFTSYFNEKYKRSGVLFQGIYKRTHIKTDKQYRYLLAYVNENHSVHGVPLPDDIMYASTWHYRQRYKSRLIQPIVTGRYDVSKNLTLAQEIYSQRENLKNEILE